MNYLVGRKLGKICELLITNGEKMMNAEEDDINKVKGECILLDISENKRKKLLKATKGRYIDEYCEKLEKMKHMNTRIECNILGKELSELGYNLRREVPIACQGNLVARRYYFTSVEITAITMFGILSFLR